MIELLFVYFIINYNAMLLANISDMNNFEMCKQVNVLANSLDTDKVYIAAEKKWQKDREKLDAFYEWWANIDTCRVEKEK